MSTTANHPATAMPEAVLERSRSLIESFGWKWAKTYAGTAPHWYAERRKEPEDDFEELVGLIAEHGYRARFGKSTYTYLEPGDGFRYWTMTGKPRLTHVINRARVHNGPAEALERVKAAQQRQEQAKRDLVDAIREAIAAGVTQLQICEALGISRPTIWRWLKEGPPPQRAGKRRTINRRPRGAGGRAGI